MKKISENFANPGNGLAQGLMNHYTPIDNIIMNVRNIFGSLLGLVVSKGEDGVSLKIQSTTFVNPEVTQEIIFNSTFDGRTFLGDYIKNQGLTDVKIICLGPTCIVYFCPADLAKCCDDKCKNCTKSSCKEMKESKLIECEMTGSIIKEELEEEMEDKTQEEINKILSDSNKIKAADAFAEKLSQIVTLSPELYIKATKDVDGHESIALRYRTEQRRPFGGKAESVVSLMNIYSTGVNAIWVGAFLNRDIYPQDVISTIESILQAIGAQPTDDECVWNISDPNNTDDTDDIDNIDQPSEN